MRNNLFLSLLFLGFTFVFSLKNTYLPGSVAPSQAWFPLRNADFSIARKSADSLLSDYLAQGRVTRNIAQNRLEGKTQIPAFVCENLSGCRIGESGEIFLESEHLTTATLTNFHLNWCDFYGALFETEYKPLTQLKIKQLSSEAMFVIGPQASRVKAFTLKKLTEENPVVHRFFESLDPPPFDFISKITLETFAYTGSDARRLVLVNFEAGENFSPGALYLLKKNKTEYEELANFFIGEKARLIQTLLESGDSNPIIEVGAFGEGATYLIVHFNGKEFETLYRKKEGDFP